MTSARAPQDCPGRGRPVPIDGPLQCEAISTSLEPPETNVPRSARETEWGELLTDQDHPVLFRHSGWAHNRRQVRAALLASATRPRAITRFDLCGSNPWVARDASDEGRLIVIADHCRSRWCVPCAKAKAQIVAANIRAKLGGEPIRFLTLTLRHRAVRLRDEIKRIYASFRRLRALPLWRSHVTGGAAILEVKRAMHADRWHVHLHILFHGTYVPQRAISAAWHAITGDSYIVDIRLLRDAGRAATYVTKYVTKPYSTNALGRPEVMAELIDALHGTRVLLTFGSWRGYKLTKPLKDVQYVPIVPLSVLYSMANAGNEAAILLRNELLTQYPGVPELVGPSPPEPQFITPLDHNSVRKWPCPLSV